MQSQYSSFSFELGTVALWSLQVNVSPVYKGQSDLRDSSTGACARTHGVDRRSRALALADFRSIAATRRDVERWQLPRGVGWVADDGACATMATCRIGGHDDRPAMRSDDRAAGVADALALMALMACSDAPGRTLAVLAVAGAVTAPIFVFVSIPALLLGCAGRVLSAIAVARESALVPPRASPPQKC